MSLLNVWVSSDRALVAVDTAAMLGATGARLEASKLVSLAHANLVLAVMGETAFLGYLFYQLHHAVQTIDYDVLVDTLPVAIDGLYREYRLQAQQLGVPLDAYRNGCEIIVVGWSPRHGRMLGMRYSLQPSAAAFVPSEIDPWCIMPAAEWKAEAPPAVDSIEALQQVAIEQVRWTRRHNISAAIGGRLLVAELSQRKLSISSFATHTI